MWSRLRLDIGWYDLLTSWIGSFSHRDRDLYQRKLESIIRHPDAGIMACLSVRSGLNLLFSALQLPPGSEIIYSAITIPDMVSIARAHQLTPVPVDIRNEDFQIDTDALIQAITPRSKMILVAQLFGARLDLSPVIEIAEEKRLLVAEDCAQSWAGRNEVVNPDVDITFYSFGAIKTSTALGGALIHVRDPDCLMTMRRIQGTYPVQNQRRYRRTIMKYAVLKLISSRIGFRLLVSCGSMQGLSVDVIVRKMTRGFTSQNLLLQLRKQPCRGLLNLMCRRILNYDRKRVDGRIVNAQRIVERLGLNQSPLHANSSKHSYWVFPYETKRPGPLMERLSQHQFDTAQYGSLSVVDPPEDRPEQACVHARQRMEATVFLPIYSDIPLTVVDRMCDVILELETCTQD